MTCELKLPRHLYNPGHEDDVFLMHLSNHFVVMGGKSVANKMVQRTHFSHFMVFPFLSRP